jgi:hypothetical protein
MNTDNKIIVGSVSINEESEWGWKYGFTLDHKISLDEMMLLSKVIETEINKIRNSNTNDNLKPEPIKK